MKKEDCKHEYNRYNVCKFCGQKNPNYANTPESQRKRLETIAKRMPLFHVKYTIATFGEHETMIRASSLGCAETRIRYALRDLFSGIGGGDIIEIKQIKGSIK